MPEDVDGQVETCEAESDSRGSNICVAIRFRPLNEREINANNEFAWDIQRQDIQINEKYAFGRGVSSACLSFG